MLRKQQINQQLIYNVNSVWKSDYYCWCWNKPDCSSGLKCISCVLCWHKGSTSTDNWFHFRQACVITGGSSLDSVGGFGSSSAFKIMFMNGDCFATNWFKVQHGWCSQYTSLGWGEPLADVGGAGPSLGRSLLYCADILQAVNTNTCRVTLSTDMHLSGAQPKS